MSEQKIQTQAAPLVSFSKEEFKGDVTTVMHVLLNQVRFNFLRNDGSNETALWALLSSTPLDYPSLYANPDLSAIEVGLTFQDVADIGLASTLMQLYDYGVDAITDLSLPTIENCESDASWAMRTLRDLDKSAFLMEWSECSGRIQEGAIQNCIRVAELALARQCLEDVDEVFSYEGSPGILTFPQMALLSGMSEQSLRTIVSRKGGLQTVKRPAEERYGPTTYFEAEHARAWLQSKGRYTPVKRVSRGGVVPMTDRRFTDSADFLFAARQRLQFLMIERGKKTLADQIAALSVEIDRRFGDEDGIALCPTVPQLMDRELMTKLGELLDLDGPRFALRASEATLTEQLQQVDRELKQPAAADIASEPPHSQPR